MGTSGSFQPGAARAGSPPRRAAEPQPPAQAVGQQAWGGPHAVRSPEGGSPAPAPWTWVGDLDPRRAAPPPARPAAAAPGPCHSLFPAGAGTWGQPRRGWSRARLRPVAMCGPALSSPVATAPLRRCEVRGRRTRLVRLGACVPRMRISEGCPGHRAPRREAGFRGFC